MKLHLSNSEGRNQITSCVAGFVAVNGVRHAHSLLVTPSQLADWTASRADALTSAHLDAVLELQP